MTEQPRTRAANMALSDPTRRRVWAYLRGDARPALVAAADAGHVPVTAVSAELVARFGTEAFEPPIMRQFIGIAVSAVLAEEGFVLARTGVRLRGDPLFGAGALFERTGEALAVRRKDLTDQLLVRLLDALTLDELRLAEQHIQNRLRDLGSSVRGRVVDLGAS